MIMKAPDWDDDTNDFLVLPPPSLPQLRLDRGTDGGARAPASKRERSQETETGYRSDSKVGA